MGQPEDAAARARGTDRPRSPPRSACSRSGIAGREAETLALADTLLALNDSAQVWDSVVTVVGRSNPGTASALVDRLHARPKVPPDQQARRLYQDAVRLEPVDSARALERMREAAATGCGNRER